MVHWFGPSVQLVTSLLRLIGNTGYGIMIQCSQGVQVQGCKVGCAAVAELSLNYN